MSEPRDRTSERTCSVCPVEDLGRCPVCDMVWFRDSSGLRRGYRVVYIYQDFRKLAEGDRSLPDA